MSEKNLVICDDDLRYAKALTENILERDELSVKVFIFTDADKVITFLRKKKVHILIVDEISWMTKKEEFQAEQVFGRAKRAVSEQIPREQLIYKYQCADDIIRQIFETYVENTKEDVMRAVWKKRTRLEAVYSPIHGIGKTSFAIAFGKERAKQEKVLYVNLEEYAGFEEHMSDENQTNLGDLLYYLKQNEGNFGLRLSSATMQMEELSYIPPIFLAPDLKEIPREEWQRFLEQIVELGVYDTILLDMSESVQGLFELLQMCDRIYMPIREDEISEQKLMRYEVCLERLQLEKIRNDTCKFVLSEDIEECVKVRMREVV